MLKTKKAAGFREYELDFNNKTYTIYQDVDGWVAVDSQGKLICESNTKRDVLDKLEDILTFGGF